MYDIYRESSISKKKSLQMGQTWVCHYEPKSKGQSLELKHRLSSKEKVPATVVSSEGDAEGDGHVLGAVPSLLISLKKV